MWSLSASSARRLPRNCGRPGGRSTPRCRSRCDVRPRRRSLSLGFAAMPGDRELTLIGHDPRNDLGRWAWTCRSADGPGTWKTWSLSALSANAGYGVGHGARVTHRPATPLSTWAMKSPTMPLNRSGASRLMCARNSASPESCRWDGALHQQRRRQAGPVLVASEDQRRDREAGHLILQMI